MKITMRIERPHEAPLDARRPPARTLKRSVLALLVILPIALIWGCSGSDDTGSEKKEAARPAAALEAARPAAALEAARPATVAVQGDPRAGRVIYEKLCRYCHGKEGMGDGAIGIALTPRPANFVNDTKRMAKSDEELYESITNGMRLAEGGEGMAMPAWKSILTTEERWDVLAYVRQLERAGQEAEQDE